jgi:hypothetical protein
MTNVNILIYKITGKQLFFTIPSNICEECDLVIDITKKIVTEINDEQIKLQVKPWLTNFFSSLIKRGWHPPVLLINGHVFSQGLIPNKDKLKQKIIQELNR